MKRAAWAGPRVVGGATWALGGARETRPQVDARSRLEAVGMVAPVVYLVVAALLVGLILFLHRSRGRAAAGRRRRRSRPVGPRSLTSRASVGPRAAAPAHAPARPAG